MNVLTLKIRKLYLIFSIFVKYSFTVLKFLSYLGHLKGLNIADNAAFSLFNYLALDVMPCKELANRLHTYLNFVFNYLNQYVLLSLLKS